MSDAFCLTNCLKLGDASSSLLFKCGLGCSEDGLCTLWGLEFEWRCRFMVYFYVYGANLSVEWIQTIKKNTEALLVADKKIGLEFTAEKSRYRFMSYE